MLNHSKANGKGPGGKKRKRDDNIKKNFNDPNIKSHQNSKFSEQHAFEEDKKPFKAHHEHNKWIPKAEFESKAVDLNSSNWYNSVPDDPSEFPPCPPDTISQLKETAKGMMQTEITAYTAKASKDSNKGWLQTAMTHGVNRDKVAAMLLALQEDPLYNLNALHKLISFVKPGNKNCATVIDMLTEVLVKNLLRPSQPLKSFNKRPLSLLDELSANNPAGRRRRLVAWYFEDQLKYEYRSFVDALCLLATSGNEVDKIKATTSLAKLLAANSEHEQILLTAVVNKLGDSSPKVRCKASQALNGLLKLHPAMKAVVVEEVERLLFRPNISYKTQLTAVDFLTSMIFRVADSGVALHLLKIYFSLFKGCVKEGVVDTRLFRSLLRGVKRAYPYAHETIESISEHMETLHRVVHIAPFGIALHALSLLFMVADYKASVTDRFYTALYEKILDPELAVTKDQNDFVQLIYNALKKDENIHRVRAFVKRILQVSMHLPVQTTCSLLYTISQVISGKPLLDPNAYVKLEAPEVKSEVPSSILEDDDDGDERYEDVREDGDKKPEKKRGVSGWVFREKKKQAERSGGYDLKHRNPAFARAEHAYYDELYPLIRHFHPTIVKFASQIYEGTTISYDGNPLMDFSLPRFLERFSFKNPKKVEPLNIPHRRQYAVKGAKALAVMSRQYITMNPEDVPMDERFLHKYLQARFSDRMKYDEDREDDDDDEVDDDEFDEIMRGLMPKGQMGAEDDSDEDEVDYAADVDQTIASQKGKKKAKRKDDDDEEEDAEDISSDEGGSEEDGSDFDDLSDDGLSDDEDSKKPTKKRKTEDDEDEFGDEFGELSDEDEEVLEFDGDEDDDDELPLKKMKKTKGDGDYGPSSSVFASSEKFAELIEATAAAGRSGGSDDIINKDNSHTKQLKWEQQRDFSSKKNWNHKKKFGKGPGMKKGSFKKPNNNKGGTKFGQKKSAGFSKK